MINTRKVLNLNFLLYTLTLSIYLLSAFCLLILLFEMRMRLFIMPSGLQLRISNFQIVKESNVLFENHVGYCFWAPSSRGLKKMFVCFVANFLQCVWHPSLSVTVGCWKLLWPSLSATVDSWKIGPEMIYVFVWMNMLPWLVYVTFNEYYSFVFFYWLRIKM